MAGTGAAALVRIFSHRAVSLVGVATVTAIAMRALFLSISEWLWHFAGNLNMSEMIPWVRWAMSDRDGAEPYALLGLVALELLGTVLTMNTLSRLSPRWRAAVVLPMLAAAIAAAWRVPPRPPLSATLPALSASLWFVLGCVVASWLLARAARRGGGVPTTLAVVLVPMCFIPTTITSLTDLTCILSPALRLHYDFTPSQVYLQYDLLPSLLALAWIKLGGTPLAFSVVVSATFYALFAGIFVVARRLFQRGELAAPLLVSLIIVRFYSVLGDLTPQATPMRLDLWVLLVGAVLVVGLRHWLVGLLLAGMCFFSRSVGVLYLGAYVLAVGADFLALRRATPPAARAPIASSLRLLAKETAAVWALVLCSLVAVRFVFGAFGSDAVALYRQLGVGMMRIAATSFYWWLLAMTGAVGCLVFSQRSAIRTRAGEAAILVVALMIGNSVYFFGRSHENNLLNVSGLFLLCAFLGIDRAWPTPADAVPMLRLAFRVAPWLIVAASAYFYAGRVVEKLSCQVTQIATLAPLLQANSGDPVPNVDCGEISGVAKDGRVFFFSKNDYWYYERCSYVPLGYTQPVHLALLKRPLISDVKRWLAGGYKIIVPRAGGDWVASSFSEFVPDLPQLDTTETANFEIYVAHR